MRLFLGLPFEEQAKDRFARAQGELKKLAGKGNFTARDNFHLTLFFLGEMDTGQADAAKAALMAAHIAPLTLTFDRLSLFPGGIYHLFPEFEPDLYAAQLRLVRALRREGFDIEDRLFTPHVTLGRKVRLAYDVDPTGPLQRPIQAQTGYGTLFLSHRVAGELTYTPLFPT